MHAPDRAYHNKWCASNRRAAVVARVYDADFGIDNLWVIDVLIFWGIDVLIFWVIDVLIGVVWFVCQCPQLTPAPPRLLTHLVGRRGRRFAPLD